MNSEIIGVTNKTNSSNFYGRYKIPIIIFIVIILVAICVVIGLVIIKYYNTKKDKQSQNIV